MSDLHTYKWAVSTEGGTSLSFCRTRREARELRKAIAEEDEINRHEHTPHQEPRVVRNPLYQDRDAGRLK